MTIRKISRALLSVSDKTGLIDFAKGLASHGVMLISTGGTARTLREASLAVADARYPRRRAALLKEWRLAEDIPAPP